MSAETGFERRRGVSRVEVRGGFVQAHLTHLGEPLLAQRLEILKKVAEAGISLDFLKLTQTGLSFLAPEARVADLRACMQGFDAELREGRSIVMVFAVNVREEEGLIARILREAIASGAPIDHVGDMHDRVLLVVPTDQAARLAEHLETTLMEAARAH
ncbi:MAG: hypothetical protein HY248_00175 [Fimbriimonas ginsengisoli]|nr:hypothetical protein [Fimbriimonas ginsengisoli]